MHEGVHLPSPLNIFILPDTDLPVRTALADGSAKSNAVLPSVFRMVGSAPCCKSTAKNSNTTFQNGHHGSLS